MNKYTIITGPRRSGKTNKALELARADGRLFAVLAGNSDLDRESRAREYPGAVYVSDDAWVVREHALLIVDDAHLIDSARWDDILALPADLIIVASPPIERAASPWLEVVATTQRIEMTPAKNCSIDPVATERFTRMAAVLKPDQARRDSLGIWVNIRDRAHQLTGRACDKNKACP